MPSLRNWPSDRLWRQVSERIRAADSAVSRRARDLNPPASTAISDRVPLQTIQISRFLKIILPHPIPVSKFEKIVQIELAGKSTVEVADGAVCGASPGLLEAPRLVSDAGRHLQLAAGRRTLS